ncbi:hypothetical protein L6164_009832 [Bauhinia variegata]|uniref:Uncharacterized protein n=1 Tax=Bauhinia variegata TaxID=167791 RepID=A0ACB9PKD0_BAUVA|nr:hypothetical protein L6164_009832 [Bauhinia variegata]
MDIQVRIRTLISHRFCSANQRSLSSSTSSFPSPFKTFCSRKDFRESQRNGDDNNKGDKYSTDWDKAWSKFKKQGKKTLFSQFSPDKQLKSTVCLLLNMLPDEFQSYIRTAGKFLLSLDTYLYLQNISYDRGASI